MEAHACRRSIDGKADFTETQAPPVKPKTKILGVWPEDLYCFRRALSFSKLSRIAVEAGSSRAAISS